MSLLCSQCGFFKSNYDEMVKEHEWSEPREDDDVAETEMKMEYKGTMI